MKNISLILLFVCTITLVWAGFPVEDFNNAASWPGTYDYTGTATFNGNDWEWYRVDQYQSGADYEIVIKGSRSGKITSHNFENGVGTITFSAAKTTSTSGIIRVYTKKLINDAFSIVYYNYSYDIVIDNTTSTTYNIPVNRPDAHYIRIQAFSYPVRIDNISVSDEISVMAPTVTDKYIENITKYSAQGGGQVTADGGATVTARGVCWDTSSMTTLASGNYTTDGTGLGHFTSQITGLIPNTTYYVRAYATNSAGTSYSPSNEEKEFITLNYVAPTAVTDDASDVNHVFAHLNGTVNGDEASTTIVFEYGLTDSYGTTVTADESPLSGAGDQSVQASLNGLVEYTTYHYRVKAINIIGTTYGSDKTFTTTNNPNQTSTQSIPAGIPDPDPIEFTGTGTTIDFSGVSGATGVDDITVNLFNSPPSNLTGLIGSEIKVSDNSYLFTNHTGFTFTAEVQFMVSDISGINTDLFADLVDGAETTLNLWKRSEYGTGDFIDQGFLLYDDGIDNINNTTDDFLYMNGINDFSEFAFSSNGDHSLPVTLTDFSTAIIMNEFVQISWTTQTEASINSWNLYRETENSTEHILINSQAGTNTTQPNTYIFGDHEVTENVVYNYYLESTEYDGTSNMWGPISAMLEDSSTPELPTTSMLQSNYPNPFNPSTSIKCDIKDGEKGVLTIYNSKGQEIEKQILNAGEHIIEWDGTAYGSGVYLYKLETDSYTKTRKMIMIK